MFVTTVAVVVVAVTRYNIANIRTLFGHKIDLRSTKAAPLCRCACCVLPLCRCPCELCVALIEVLWGVVLHACARLCACFVRACVRVCVCVFFALRVCVCFSRCVCDVYVLCGVWCSVRGVCCVCLCVSVLSVRCVLFVCVCACVCMCVCVCTSMFVCMCACVREEGGGGVERARE